MSKRTSMDKQQVRERRNRLLDSAAAAELSLTQGVREMRAIAGMTQEEFARHRGVSARVIKTIETGQANPTVATLNQIGQFFGLEVGFVPIRRTPPAEKQSQPGKAWMTNAQTATTLEALSALLSPDIGAMDNVTALHAIDNVLQSRKNTLLALRDQWAVTTDTLNSQLETLEELGRKLENATGSHVHTQPTVSPTETPPSGKVPGRKKRKTPSL